MTEGLNWTELTEYATRGQFRSNSRKNEEIEPKQKQHSAVDGTGDGSKVNAVKNNIAQEPGMLGPRIRAN